MELTDIPFSFLQTSCRLPFNISGTQVPSRAHHAATVAAVPDWRAMVDRARFDAMAEFWPRSRSY